MKQVTELQQRALAEISASADLRLLDELRVRKNDEQPLRTALINAYKELAEQFPEE